MDNKSGITTDLTKIFVIIALGKKINKSQQGITPIFAISRASGWTAQVLEQLDDNRLYRPLTDYTGPDSQPEILPINERD